MRPRERSAAVAPPTGFPSCILPGMARPDSSTPVGDEARAPEPAAVKLQSTLQANRVAQHGDLELPIFAGRADRLLAVLDAMQVWVSEFDGAGHMIFSNAHSESILGFTPEECLKSDCLEFHPEDIHSVIAMSRMVRETGGASTNQARLRHRDGHWVWIETTLLGWSPSPEGGFHAISFSRDLSALKQAEAGKRESEERYRVVSRMSCDLIVETDEKGRQTYVGPGTEEIIGYTAEEALALPPKSMVHPDDLERIRTQFEQEFSEDPKIDSSNSNALPRVMEYRVRHRDGHWLWFETLGRPYPRADGEIRFLAVSRNVTERKLAEAARRELEEAMQRSQRLESLGVLAGGIAHDFNNLLTPILGAAGLGIDELPEDSPVRARFEKIQQAARRAASLTHQMLAYAGQRPMRVTNLDLSKLVSEMIQLVTASISGKTKLDLELASDLPCVEAEAAQLAQVVMNLITNAVESLSNGKGRISLRTGVVEVDVPPAGALFADTMKPGLHVFLEVTDTGGGMDEATRLRIFEPFYTTKFTGRGLGLAAVAGIVRSHLGAIEVSSEPGRGTTFRVLLPAAGKLPSPEEASPVSVAEWRTSGTVLVIDDDEDVRALAQDVLQRAGMTVLSAGDGHEGVKLFGLHADEIGIVLLDRTMPTLSGSDALDAIRKLRPDAKIIVVSGYSEESVTSELQGHKLAGFLQKPFLPETLLARVRTALESPEAD